MAPRSTGAVRIDERTDITQLGVVVLSLLAGRRIGPDDYPDKTGELLDELTLKNHLSNPTNPAKFQALRHWLERALQLSGQSFTSAHDAEAALVDLQEPGESRGTPTDAAFRLATKPAAVNEEPAPMWSAARGLPAPAALTPAPPPPPRPTKPARITVGERVAALRARLASARDRLVQSWRSVPAPLIRWAGAAIAVLAISEAVFIGWLLSTRSTASGSAAATAPAPAVASSAPARPDVQSIQQPSTASLPLVAATATVDPKLPEIRTPQPPAPAVRTGGIRLTTPIELTVLDGERVIGSSAEGPIIATAGRHEFDFVNSAIGYRTRQVVEVRAGQIISVHRAGAERDTEHQRPALGGGVDRRQFRRRDAARESVSGSRRARSDLPPPAARRTA